jgi:carboxyl-terminal processing protease
VEPRGLALRGLRIVALGCVLTAGLSYAGGSLGAQSISSTDKYRAKQMLRNIGGELKKNYYDPTFGGLDLDAHLKAAIEKLDSATSVGQTLAIVAQALLDLNDSHTFFVPPARTIRVEYGWRMQMVGDQCYVTAVKPGSDATSRGLKVGDEILAIDRFRPTRGDLWKLEYSYNLLNPRSGVTLAVRSPGAAPREIGIAAKATQRVRVLDLNDSFDIETLLRDLDDSGSQHGLKKVGSVVVWKMPDFSFMNHDELLAWALKDADALILDLRGNPGGYVKTLERVAGRFFDRDVTIADLKGRKQMPPMRARKNGRTFTGRVVALIDSRTGSAAELFARVLQLEKRGTVIGDRSSGSVRQAYGLNGQIGTESLVLYGASITNAEVIMSDGKSLERVGVTPDELVVPTAEDLAAGRDPVLVRAAALLGIQLDPVTAGKMFPFEWR